VTTVTQMDLAILCVTSSHHLVFFEVSAFCERFYRVMFSSMENWLENLGFGVFKT